MRSLILVQILEMLRIHEMPNFLRTLSLRVNTKLLLIRFDCICSCFRNRYHNQGLCSVSTSGSDIGTIGDVGFSSGSSSIDSEMGCNGGSSTWGGYDFSVMGEIMRSQFHT
ncbi:hypothetical protein TorRG33x02_153500 [Trema orientale]|uniref:Uncharacterized protein n=1 Tax=Trema orientale TaxID=63057 RepID=A0A2P5ETK9_TREOI|nr:hypothetical protein TorRG33x02_153500 [Trema orientale]